VGLYVGRYGKSNISDCSGSFKRSPCRRIVVCGSLHPFGGSYSTDRIVRQNVLKSRGNACSGFECILQGAAVHIWAVKGLDPTFAWVSAALAPTHHIAA
jgi:hypothetical protein